MFADGSGFDLQLLVLFRSVVGEFAHEYFVRCDIVPRGGTAYKTTSEETSRACERILTQTLKVIRKRVHADSDLTYF